ncbi:hypothetical protein FACS1894219_12730 [Clostridia bacterium]|nr:hypothetical protein FACS1894219_12730 [Clostridia bacterium]
MSAKVKSNLNVRIDASIKERAGELLRRMGIDHTTAIEMFYRQIINENRLPFTPKPLESIDEQLIAAVHAKNYPKIILETNENGDIIVDKEKDPELYDFAVGSIDEQLIAAIEAKNIPHVKLDSDENGNIIIDDRIKEQYPEIYDWAVNG